MNAITFLRDKKILDSDKTKWKITFDDGREYDFVELMNEFAIQACVEQIHLCAQEYGAFGKSYDSENDRIIKKTPLVIEKMYDEKI